MVRKQILVVEDNELNREILCELLSEQYTVLQAENGRDALDILKQCTDDIALILLDVMMPVMDGFTFLDQIKQDPALSLIPVIVTTQSDSEADEIMALSHGATDFVPKPYRPQAILHRVASIISLRENAAMVNQFRYDRLTGLYSKEFFYQKVRELLEAHPDQSYQIVCSNVVNFKLYNDTFGTQAGDQLLQNVSRILEERLGAGGICGRLTADRFACIQESTPENMGQPVFDAQNEQENITWVKNLVMKWGIYEITDRTIPVEQMCDRAMLALDSIKGHYNQNTAVYDDTLRSKLLREQDIAGAMDAALEEHQFQVYLQPKFSLTDQSMIGAEALVRWTHPKLGFLSPGEFVPLFEKNGFIPRLDQYVWEQVCALLSTWKQRNWRLLPVSVNVSRADIYQTNLVETLCGLVEKYNVNPMYLHLEVTESAYTDDPGKIIETIDELRSVGFIIEMDDFGSGYSSLNMLSQMRLDVLKLDMKFIQSEMEKTADQGILRFIVGLAHWMNLSVVAEGVETAEQVERLRSIGCDYGQGYFYARPMPVQEYEQRLQSQADCCTEILPLEEVPEETEKLVLVVEENDHTRELLRKALDGVYKVVTTDDTVRAQHRIMKHGREISTVLLSLTLPDHGAAAVLNTLRGNPETWRVPVLGLTTWNRGLEPQDKELDVNDIAYKPRDQICLNCLQRRVEWVHTLTDCQERERQFQDEASRDFLTGLLNRRGLETALDGLTEKDYPMAAYLFDLDDLKCTNDQHGHEAGDLMLRIFADLLRNNTREGDLLCRYGGDEFVVFLRSISSEETALRKGEQICREFQNRRIAEGLCGGCSGGAVLCKTPVISVSKLVEHVDQALYRAKQKHKGGCVMLNGPVA